MGSQQKPIDLTQGLRYLVMFWVGPRDALASVLKVMAADLERQARPFLSEAQHRRLQHELAWLKRDVRMSAKAKLN